MAEFLRWVDLTRTSILKIIGPPIISSIVTFILLTISALIVSGLPRPREQEPVSVAWSVCLLGAVGVALFVPWFISLPFVKSRGMRLYLFVCLAISVAVWYYFGLEGFLNKAYRRGF